MICLFRIALRQLYIFNSRKKTEQVKINITDYNNKDVFAQLMIDFSKKYREYMNCKKSTLITCFALSLVLYQCLGDVPHSNPLDPGNSNFGFSISGSVTTYYSPTTPISNAIVTLLPDKAKFVTANDGFFSFTKLIQPSYDVVVAADGYVNDTLHINLQSNTVLDFQLNALPYFENITLTTHHDHPYYPPERRYFLRINAAVNDPDGYFDINRVYFSTRDFQLDSVTIVDTLNASMTQGHFSRLVDIIRLNVGEIKNLIGHEFVMHVIDDVGATVKVGGNYVFRIMDKSFDETNMKVTAVPAPADSAGADSTRFFNWIGLNLDYNYKHTIEVYQENLGGLTFILDIKNIPKATVKQQIPFLEDEGDYVWVITATDDLGNTTRSRERSFTIRRTN
ncbi:MAG: carboxypeptidase regulatory-like domain-containing protein [Calditrichaeota bacterium]|nr:MAG: carboxypeptidase regulatory-like domain-containing protein [Calditrichota bacterium]